MRQILDENVRFTAGMTEATKAFAQSKPWRGTVAERAQKFLDYHEAVAKESELPHVLLICEDTITDASRASGSSHIDQRNPSIVLSGRLSGVTDLFLASIARRYDRRAAMNSEVNSFKR